MNGTCDSNSAELIREALLSGWARACATWEIGPETPRGRAQGRAAGVSRPSQRRDPRRLSLPRVHAGQGQRVYRVSGRVYGAEPYWDKGIDYGKPTKSAPPAIKAAKNTA